MDHKHVTIYADKDNNLIVNANGIIDKWGGIIAGIDVIESLNAPFKDSEVERLLFSMMDKCCSLTPEEGGASPIEKYLGVKGYAKAVKGKKLINFTWRINEGYTVTPTKREKKGFVHLDEKKLLLGENIVDGALAKALKRAIEESISI